MVNLLEHGIGQFHSVNHPASLAGVARIREIFVAGFQPTEVVGVHLFRRLAVRAEQNAVLIVEEEFPRAAWLPAEFGFAGPKLHHHVGVFVQPERYGIQIFRPIGHVQGDERRMRMFLDDVIPLGH